MKNLNIIEINSDKSALNNFKHNLNEKIFISNINGNFSIYLGYVGSVLVETLRNDHINDVNPKFIHGTISESEPENPFPKGASEMY